MKSYIQVFDRNGNEIENFITHYTTVRGFMKYGVKNWIKKNEAASFSFSTFSDSSQLYAGNFINTTHHVVKM